MNSLLPCRAGKARPCAAAFSLVLISAALSFTPAQARPPRARSHPARPRPAAPPFLLTPTLSGKAASPVQTLLTRFGLPEMRANNAVRLWVRGDGSGASLRVRLISAGKNLGPDLLPLCPQWVSDPVAIDFVGWHELALSQSQFKAVDVDPASWVDLSLPADAQPISSHSDMPEPDWSAVNALALSITTSRQSRLVLDDIAWVTLDSSGQGTDSTVVTNFETGNVGAWNAVGTSEETNAVTYGVTTDPNMVHGGRVAFRLTVTPPDLLRQTLLPSVQAAMRNTGKPYLVWKPDALFAPVLPETLPPASGATSEVTMQACPEQTQAATFCLYSPVALRNVTVSLPQDLQGIGHTIPRADVDIHVVKVWPQGGAGCLRDPDTAGAVPELLVKDDRAVLSGSASEARLAGPAVCDIPADSAKQFWITVSVPRNTPSNNYIGRLMVTGRGLSAPFPVRLVLSVLPLRLLSPAKQYGIDLRSRLDPAPATLPSVDGKEFVTDFVTKDVLDKQLADIYAHGFTIATLYDSPDTLWDAITEYKNWGLGTSYNLYRGDGDPRAIETQRRANGCPPLTYYTDPEPTDAAQARMDPLNKAGIPNATYIPRQADYDTLQADSDLVVYNRDSEYAQQLLRTKGQRVSQTRDWWYWSATDEDPKTNRVDTGFLLWRANLYGAFLPDYQTAFGTDPYDETSAGACSCKAAFRPLMLTYPVKDGVLDTLQWEACREGVSDVRYLTTMYAALRECKDAHIAKPLVGEAETYVKTFMDKPLANLSDDQYDTFRAQVANYAMLLRKAVDGYNKAHHIQ